MTMERIDVSAAAGGAQLRVRVKPGGRRERLVGAYNGGLKVEVAAPPEDGRANEACGKFLAEGLGVPARQVVLRSGATSRNKVFLIEGMTPETLISRAETWLAKV